MEMTGRPEADLSLSGVLVTSVVLAGEQMLLQLDVSHAAGDDPHLADADVIAVQMEWPGEAEALSAAMTLDRWWHGETPLEAVFWPGGDGALIAGGETVILPVRPDPA